MSVAEPTSDGDVLNLIRIAGPLSVTELTDAMQVTPTAVRQRLVRLMSREMIQREAIRAGRGRPKHRYWLTDRGLRQTGSNFNDLAMVLWREVHASGNQGLCRDVLRRLAKALAGGYAIQIRGNTPAERLRSLGELLEQRGIPVSVEALSDPPTLTAHACPYPKLAEEDKSVCLMEKMLFSELIGGDVQLTQCRLEGGTDCRFEAR